MVQKRQNLRKRPVLLFAYLTFGLAFALVLIAFATPNWLASDERLYGHQFVKLGLWEQCFRSITFPEQMYEGVYFVGCRWLFSPWTKYYDKFRDEIILQPFFVAVQVLFTLSLVFALVACVLVILYFVCCGPEYYLVLFATSLDLVVAAFLGTIAVLVFGARGDGRDWMPDPDHNFLSWSFGLAVIGVYFLWNASLLFYIEARRLRKQEKNEEQGMYGISGHSKA